MKSLMKSISELLLGHAVAILLYDFIGKGDIKVLIGIFAIIDVVYVFSFYNERSKGGVS